MLTNTKHRNQKKKMLKEIFYEWFEAHITYIAGVLQIFLKTKLTYMLTKPVQEAHLSNFYC